jgi:hypothetical protein
MMMEYGAHIGWAADIGSMQCCALCIGLQVVDPLRVARAARVAVLWLCIGLQLPTLCVLLDVLQADTYITAFRRWLASFGGGGPFGDVTQPNYLEQIGARQSREQLLDRWGVMLGRRQRVVVVSFQLWSAYMVVC